MPTYDYACSGCKHRYERFESIGDGGPKPCPRCGKKKAKRMIGAGAGLIFKGSGFYATDSKGPPPAKDNGGDSKDGEKKTLSKDGEKKTPDKDGEKKAPAKEKKEDKEPKK